MEEFIAEKTIGISKKKLCMAHVSTSTYNLLLDTTRRYFDKRKGIKGMFLFYTIYQLDKFVCGT